MIFQNDDFLNWVFDRAHIQPFHTERHPLDFHPSSPSAIDSQGTHYGECLRSLWYKKTGQAPDKPEVDSTGALIMDCGTALGKMLAEYFQNAGVGVAPLGSRGEQDIRIYRSTPAGNEYRINGYIDALATGSHGEVIGYEFKTVWGSNKANRVIHGWRTNAAPDLKNLLQIAIYAWYGRTHMGIFDWRLTYLWVDYDKSKTALLGRTYNITVDAVGKIYVDGSEQPVNINDVFRQYDKLADALVRGEAPDREGELFHTKERLDLLEATGELTKRQKEQRATGKQVQVPWSPCNYCNYVGTCYGADALKENNACRS